MTFRREIHHDVRLLLFKDFINCRTIAYVGPVKNEVVLCHGLLQGRHVSRIGETVHAYKSVFRMPVLHIVYEVCSDKAGTAGDKYFFHVVSPKMITLQL